MAKTRGVDWLLSKVLLVQHSVILTLPADTSLNYVLYYVDALSLFQRLALHSLQKSFPYNIFWPSRSVKEVVTLPPGMALSSPGGCKHHLSADDI